MDQQQTPLRRRGFRRLFSISAVVRTQPPKAPNPLTSSEGCHQTHRAMETGPAKLAAVTSLVDKLTQDLDTVNLLPHQRDEALEQLKIYGRHPINAEPIFTRRGIEMLTRHAFNSPSSTTSKNALRCLCNALLLKKECRQMVVDLGYEAKACNKLKNDDCEDEFLVSRVLFLTTYDTDLKLGKLIDEHHLADNSARNLERHAKRSLDVRHVASRMELMALDETAKLLFNVTHHCKEKASSFTACIPHIATLLCKGTFEVTRPLDQPVGSLINALLNLDLGAKEVHSSLYPAAAPTLLTNRLIDILDQSRSRYHTEDLESITPLTCVLRALHQHAPKEVQTSMRQRLLPSEADRTEVLGRTGTLPSWLLKNSTNAVAENLRETISDLLFDLSDNDASKFIENFGYGYASGYLFKRNIEVPENASRTLSGTSQGSDRPVNPITGQFLDLERHPEGPEMTDAEKEREAEKLFVLFQRLEQNGIISVENPLRTAVQEGRFEELPDDHEEDVD
ncbi:guanine nucleotide exchange factor [Xylariaceae sp. FL0594]|nr:guanine nucleotide exchange factor [Xylariaceae sp. FL0594]